MVVFQRHEAMAPTYANKKIIQDKAVKQTIGNSYLLLGRVSIRAGFLWGRGSGIT